MHCYTSRIEYNKRKARRVFMKTIITYLVLTFSLTYIAHGTLALLTHSNTFEFNSPLAQALFIIGGLSPTLFALLFILKNADS
jgi:hypothetical protein